MNNKTKNRGLFIVIVLLITFLSIIVLASILGIIMHKSGQMLDTKEEAKIVFLRDDILITASDGREMVVNLPKKLDDNYTYAFNFVPERTVPNEKLFMYLKGSYHVFTLSYQDKIIYQKTAIDTSFVKSGGDYIRIVMIPDDYIGKELTISFKSLKHSNYGILIPIITLGSHSDLIFYSYTDKIDVMIVAAFLLVFSIESFIIQTVLIFYKKANISSCFGSLYAMILGLYIFIRTPAMFFFVPKGSFIYVFDYLLFLLLPLSVAMFMISIARQKGGKVNIHKIIEIIIAFFVLHLIAQILLTWFGCTEFMELQQLSQIVVVTVALISVFVPFTIKNFEFKRVLSVSIAVLMVLLVILLAVYLSTYRLRYLTILGLVGGLFILFQSLVIMKIYANNYAISYRAALNKGLAFTDNLTRLNNRNAFERDISQLVRHGQKMMLMIIDINSLKAINDQFGHNTGDLILKNIAEILNKIRIKYNKTTAYRIGGDEFVITAFDVDESYAQKVAHYLNSQAEERAYIAKFNQFRFGIGYKVTTVEQDFNIDIFMREVDKKMYEDKKLKKRNFGNEEPKMLVIEQ